MRKHYDTNAYKRPRAVGNRARVSCLACSRMFMSPDKTRIRRGQKCKTGLGSSASNGGDEIFPNVGSGCGSRFRLASETRI